MAVSMKGRSLVSIADFSAEEIWQIWDLAAELKRKQKVGEPHLVPLARDWGATERGWGHEERATSPSLLESSMTNTGEPARDEKDSGRRQGRPAPQCPRPCRQSDGAEESACGKATGMAKALRERGGKRYKGTQGTRQLSTMDVVESWRNGRHHTCPSLVSRMRYKLHVRCSRGDWGNVP